MTKQQQAAVEALKFGLTSDIAKRVLEALIDTMSDSERLEVQEAIGDSHAPRNLFYNYETQKYIEA